MSEIHLSAAALSIGAAVFAAVGALIGILLRGSIDGRLLDRQLAQQRAVLDQQRDALDAQLAQQREALGSQLQLQRDLAREAAANDRAKTLLTSRHEIYASVLTICDDIDSSLISVSSALGQLEEEFPDFDRNTTERTVQTFTPARGLRDETSPAWLHADRAQVHQAEARQLLTLLDGEVQKLRLIAPGEVVKSLEDIQRLRWEVGYSGTDNTCQKIDETRRSMSSAAERFLAAARRDLAADPVD